MKTLYTLVVIVVVGIMGFFLLNEYIYNQKQAGGSQAQPEELAAYFGDEMYEAGTADGLIPIEGFDAGLLLGKFGGLEPSDFAGVEALQGHYEVKNDEVVFVFTAEAEHSAARTVSEEGYATLLENVSARLKHPIYTEADVDALIEKINLETRKTVSASVGQTVGAFGAIITPQEVLEDSRCPTGVQCVWEGTVTVRALLESGSGATNQEFTLNETITTETESITLVSVVPDAKEGQEIPVSDYIFTFNIEQR